MDELAVSVAKANKSRTMDRRTLSILNQADRKRDINMYSDFVVVNM